MKLPTDVLTEWVTREYITQDDATTHEAKYLSYIEQAKQSILAYCNIPLTANMPDGLFFAWVEISYATSNGTTMIDGSGAIKSISEGDTSITFDVGTTVVKGDKVTIDYTKLLNRFRRLP